MQCVLVSIVGQALLEPHGWPVLDQKRMIAMFSLCVVRSVTVAAQYAFKTSRQRSSRAMKRAVGVSTPLPQPSAAARVRQLSRTG